MPQDTLRIGTGPDDYVILEDSSFTTETKEQLHKAAQEKGYEKRPASNDWVPLLSVVGMLVLIWIIIRIRDGKSKGYVAFGSLVNNEADYDIVEGEPEVQDYLLYEGDDLRFGEEEIIKVLNKRCAYYSKLSGEERSRFLLRLQKFMKQKSFYIHDKSGFKEMPILVSAAAIQFSFGLEKYLLPDFPGIHIFPEEFIATEPTIRYLEGNVSNNCINISWKHFLNGFNSPADGQNVGLHEFAHAYYFQNFETGNQVDNGFITDFKKFDNYGNKVFELEKIPGNDLYSEYAMKNFQEFWAESVEIFFERPGELKALYPDLYAAISNILNQDPATAVTGQ